VSEAFNCPMEDVRKTRLLYAEASASRLSLPRSAGDDSVPDASASRSLRIEAPCLSAELYNEFYNAV
jgi:hypothetical protein